MDAPLTMKGCAMKIRIGKTMLSVMIAKRKKSIHMPGPLFSFSIIANYFLNCITLSVIDSIGQLVFNCKNFLICLVLCFLCFLFYPYDHVFHHCRSWKSWRRI